MTLQHNLNSLKGKKMPDATTFGKLQPLVPVPYSKFDNMDNPRPKMKIGSDDYTHCGFYNCKFYGSTIERRIHVKNQHSTRIN